MYIMPLVLSSGHTNAVLEHMRKVPSGDLDDAAHHISFPVGRVTTRTPDEKHRLNLFWGNRSINAQVIKSVYMYLQEK